MKNKKIIIAIIWVCSILFIIPLSTAIFKITINASDTLVAADWSVSLNQAGISDNINVVSGFNSPSYTLNLVSGSEVDVKYDVIVNNIPTGVQVSIDGVNYRTPSGGTVIFSNAGTILYSNQETESTELIYFRSETGTTPVSNHTVTIDVEVSQII